MTIFSIQSSAIVKCIVMTAVKHKCILLFVGVLVVHSSTTYLVTASLVWSGNLVSGLSLGNVFCSKWPIIMRTGCLVWELHNVS